MFVTGWKYGCTVFVGKQKNAGISFVFLNGHMEVLCVFEWTNVGTLCVGEWTYRFTDVCW